MILHDSLMLACHMIKVLTIFIFFLLLFLSLEVCYVFSQIETGFSINPGMKNSKKILIVFEDLSRSSDIVRQDRSEDQIATYQIYVPQANAGLC